MNVADRIKKARDEAYGRSLEAGWLAEWIEEEKPTIPEIIKMLNEEGAAYYIVNDEMKMLLEDIA